MKLTKQQQRAVTKLEKFLIKHGDIIIACYKADGAPYGWTGTGMTEWWRKLTKR